MSKIIKQSGLRPVVVARWKDSQIFSQQKLSAHHAKALCKVLSIPFTASLA